MKVTDIFDESELKEIVKRKFENHLNKVYLQEKRLSKIFEAAFKDTVDNRILEYIESEDFGIAMLSAIKYKTNYTTVERIRTRVSEIVDSSLEKIVTEQLDSKKDLINSSIDDIINSDEFKDNIKKFIESKMKK